VRQTLRSFRTLSQGWSLFHQALKARLTLRQCFRQVAKPHLDEAYRVAELVFPHLPSRAQPARTGGHAAGEVMANQHVPRLAAAS
jgi:hypothetical protein